MTLIFTAYVKSFNDFQIESAAVQWQTAQIFLQQQSFLKKTRSLLLAITGWLQIDKDDDCQWNREANQEAVP